MAVVAVVLLLAACGQSPSITLTLDAANAVVLRGGDVELDVTLTRAGGASADVALTITGLPPSVTAQFSPATLSGATLSSTLTISAAAATSAGNFDVTVTGTGTGLGDSAELTLDVTSLTVSGRVASLFDYPLPGASVRSQGDSAITDVDGNFTLTGLSVPYDLAVWDQAAGWVHIFEGMTAADVLITPVSATAPSPTARTSVVTGDLTGGVIPVAADQAVLICVEGIDAIAIGCSSVGPTSSNYSVSVQWVGEPSRDVRIHALQVQRDATGHPTAYLGHATMNTTLQDGVGTMANLDLGGALSTVTVDVDIDATTAFSFTIAALQLGPNLSMPIALLSGTTDSHQFLMPTLDDAAYTFVAAVDVTQFGWQADVTSTTAKVTVPGDIQLVTPANIETGVTTSTPFTVASTSSGPKTFLWHATDSTLTVGKTTMATSTTIPDLTPFGLTLPASSDFSWNFIDHTVDSTEDAANAINDYYNFNLMLSLSSRGLRGEGTFNLSDAREFTTAP